MASPASKQKNHETQPCRVCELQFNSSASDLASFILFAWFYQSRTSESAPGYSQPALHGDYFEHWPHPNSGVKARYRSDNQLCTSLRLLLIASVSSQTGSSPARVTWVQFSCRVRTTSSSGASMHVRRKRFQDLIKINLMLVFTTRPPYLPTLIKRVDHRSRVSRIRNIMYAVAQQCHLLALDPSFESTRFGGVDPQRYHIELLSRDVTSVY
ncbi:hypothetical protein EV424DRAFT_575438 [Suillus variegatus]|nr:hypothetical protein EV424DRAFT_575438 [Suillus variegatus]